MISRWLPTRVRLPPLTVPRLMVTYSRISLWSPISSRVGSPWYVTSCGAMPIAQKGKNELSDPILVGPSIATCDNRRQFSPNSTSAPITQYGPTVHEDGTFAPESINAVGCTCGAAMNQDRNARDVPLRTLYSRCPLW